MKARDVIEQIKTLSPEEQAKVFDFIDEMKAREPARTIDPEAFAKAADWVSREHAELMRKLSE